MKNFIFLSLAFMLVSCDKPEVGNGFTLKSGVTFLSNSSCLAGGPESDFVKIEQNYNNQIVKINWHLPCGNYMDDPYLSIRKNKMQTLVVSNSKGHGSCECQKNINVKIQDRIKDGDTLYVVVNGEVVAHQLIEYK